MSEEIKKYDDGGNCIYWKRNNIHKSEYYYDKKERLIHYRDNTDYQIWYEYSENNNVKYIKTSSGFEEWYKYNERGFETAITKEEFEEIKFCEQEQEFLSREPISRFELIEL